MADDRLFQRFGRGFAKDPVRCLEGAPGRDVRRAPDRLARPGVRVLRAGDRFTL